MSFTPRLTDSGISSSVYYISDTKGGYNLYTGENNPLDEECLSTGNCTWYAWGRSAEIAGKDIADEFPKYGDAVYWFGATAWDKDNGSNLYERVELGDIVCFSGLTHGHVEVVEQITDDMIITSSSSYDATHQYEYFFKISTDVKANYYPKTSFIVGSRSDLSPSHSMQGVIHNPYAGGSPTGTYTLSYSVSPAGAGYWTGSAEGEYEEGATISITAHANTGYAFSYIQGSSGQYTDPTITRTMSKNRNYVAYFSSDATLISCYAKILEEEGKINEITIYL